MPTLPLRCSVGRRFRREPAVSDPDRLRFPRSFRQAIDAAPQARSAVPRPHLPRTGTPLTRTTQGWARGTMFNRMVDGSMLDGIYHALSDPSRRAIVWRLAAEGELKVTELAHPFDMSLNAVSKHIKVLEGAGLVQRRVAGRDHWLSLESEPLAAAHSWIGLYQQFWERRVDVLVEHLEARASRGD
jgi:DNA-binding transcriptional ArsR family regulator